MLKPIIQGSVAWQDLYEQGYIVVKKDEYEQHWPHPQGWRPIETAPKDDTEVLVLCEDGGILIGCHCGVKWWIEQTRFEERKPTHWMPLPEPPK